MQDLSATGHWPDHARLALPGSRGTCLKALEPRDSSRLVKAKSRNRRENCVRMANNPPADTGVPTHKSAGPSLA